MSASSKHESGHSLDAHDAEHTNNENMNVSDMQSDSETTDAVHFVSNDVSVESNAMENEQDMLVTAEHNQADGTALSPDVIPDDVQEFIEPVLPDRANAPVSVVTERFLRAIVAHIPIERIAELHLFSPLRQGGVETGIAVIAADVEVPETVVEILSENALELEFGQLVSNSDVVEGDAELTGEDDQANDIDASDVEAGEVVAIDGETESDNIGDFQLASDEDGENAADIEGDQVIAIVRVDEESEAGTDTDAGADVDAQTGTDANRDAEDPAHDDDSPYADEDADIVDHVAEDHMIVVHAQAPVAAADATGIPDAQLVVEPVRHVRHTVYTARYRLVLKGPDRGKWESDVVNEADAPLVAVETVVRGVQRRAGEATETIRFTASQIAHALRFVAPS